MGILDRLRPKYVIGRTVYVGIQRVKNLSAAQLYAEQPELRTVISFLADNVASLPLKCYVRKPDGSRVRDRESTLAQLLEHPNAWTTRYELVRATVSEYLLHDFALWLTVPADTRSGWAVVSVPNVWLEPHTLDNLQLSDVRINPPHGEAVTVSRDDFIAFRGWSPDGGAASCSRVDALKDILEEQMSAWAFRNGVWAHGGRVTQWISRPADTPWGEGARDRFAESWKNKFSGNHGTDTGGTPLLEDGMRLETTTFNAREAQWEEATKLSRDTICSVYHMKAGQLYDSGTKTYASVKENARSLYVDTLSPLLAFLTSVINGYLVPRLGLDETHYCEFDISAKLQGSFEEQAAVISSAVGAPWMTRDEARERMNLPKLQGQGSDGLVVPLNVLVGGQASPRDVDGEESPYAFGGAPSVKAITDGVRVKSAPEDTDAKEITDALRRFYKRQARSIIPKLNQKDRFPEWWDSGRWTRELSDDLAPIFQRQASRRGIQAVIDAGLGGEFDTERIENYIKAMAKGKAQAINDVTYRELRLALDGDLDDDALGSTVEGVFEKAEGQRAETSGRSFATAVAGFAILEACNQRGNGREVTKTWIVTSSNPRPEHAAMDGETVAYDEEFSNGAKFPGDQVLTPEESCNCQCQVEIYVP